MLTTTAPPITDDPYLLRKSVKLNKAGGDIRSALQSGTFNRDQTICKLTILCISTFMEVPVSDLTYHNGYRSRDARGLCYYLIYKHSNLSFAQIGKKFRRAKSGVYEGVRKMTDAVEGRHYPEFTQMAQLTEQMIDTFTTV